MKDRPILFSGPMVRAILAGTKTQTRRALKSHLQGAWPERARKPEQACPYGSPGDRLWVRETWGYRGASWTNARPDESEYTIHYQADDARRKFIFPETWDRAGLPKQHPPPAPKHDEDFEAMDARDAYYPRYWKSWRPSIFMPRWASRISLEVTGVRVERLQDISEDDAWREGVACTEFPDPYRESFGIGTPGRAGYAQLWESINGGAPWKCWEDNPWVWVVEFKRVEA